MSGRGLMSQEELNEVAGPKTQGPMPTESSENGEKQKQQSLEEALGEELVQKLLRENQELKRQQELQKSGSNGSWMEVSPQEPTPQTPRVERSQENEKARFTPGGTQVPLGTPPSPGVERVVASPLPPIPPFPGVELYEMEQQSHYGPCLREMGRTWRPKGYGRSHPLQWSIYPGRDSSVQEWYVKQALNDWDRRNFKQDDSWRMDRVPPPLAPPPPPSAPRADVFAQLHGTELGEHLLRDRASHSSELGLHQHHSGVCQDSRADASIDLGLLRQHHNECHDSRAATGFVLGEHLQHSGECPRDRALAGTVLGVHQPHFGVYPDSRALGVSYHGDQAGCQQPHCQGLRDPTVDGVGGGSRGQENGQGERVGHVKSPRERSPQDALRSTNPTVPSLPPPNKKHASIEAADWLEEMKPIIGDISNRASKWWELTLARTWEVYHVWLHSNPLQRIRLSPPDPVPWQDLGNEQVVKRLEQRVTTILLPALPSEMRNDLVTSRQLWPCAILYKILQCYQPGGWAERSSLLTDLTCTKIAKDASTAAHSLRLWHRQKQRATELGASIPDALLQVRALENIVSQAVMKHPQTLFRISSFRMEVGLDEQPSETTIAQFLELLTAEMDSIALGSSVGATEQSQGPAAKVLQTQPERTSAQENNPNRPCRFWGSDKGCKHGKECKFLHGQLEDQSKRCFYCSSPEHRKNDCPHRDTSQSTSSKLIGGSGKSDGVGGGKSKGGW